MDDLPERDHVVRYVRPGLVLDDGTVDGKAFQLRRRENGLSVHWLERWGGDDRTNQLAEVRRVSRLNRRPNGKFAELPVGESKDYVLAQSRICVRFAHDPLPSSRDWPDDPSHSQIVNVPTAGAFEATRVGELLAECVVVMHPATP